MSESPLSTRSTKASSTSSSVWKEPGKGCSGGDGDGWGGRGNGKGRGKGKVMGRKNGKGAGKGKGKGKGKGEGGSGGEGGGGGGNGPTQGSSPSGTSSVITAQSIAAASVGVQAMKSQVTSLEHQLGAMLSNTTTTPFRRQPHPRQV